MTKETKWTIDPAHSEIAFKIKHLMITNVRGVFKNFDADITTTGDDFTTAQIDVWIDATSIDTGDAKRDEHLKGAEFFDTKKYKEITFELATIEKSKKDGSLALWGDLIMKGISRRIKLDVQFGGLAKDPWGNERAGFTVTGKINRKEWELNWNTSLETGGMMVGEEVTINCEVQLIKANNKEMKMEAKASNSEEVTAQ